MYGEIEHTKLEILSLLSQIERPGVEDLLLALQKTDFFDMPASTKYHGNFRGGLAAHSLKVFQAAIALAEAWPVPVKGDSIVICSLLHDVCKIGAYKPDGEGWIPADDYFPYGHGEASVRWIEQYMTLDHHEALAIRWHMGAYEDGDKRLLSAAMKDPLVLLIHTADMVASALMEESKKV